MGTQRREMFHSANVSMRALSETFASESETFRGVGALGKMVHSQNGSDYIETMPFPSKTVPFAQGVYRVPRPLP
jgi:hypothetical protein